MWLISPARNGEPTLRENGIFLHSAYNPAQEAARLVAQVTTTGTSPKAYIFLAFGLGYLPLALTKAEHSGQIVLIEPDPARLALAFRYLDWTPLLTHPGLVLLIGASTQTVIGALNRLIPSLAAARIFSQPAQTAHAAPYFAELSELIRRNSEKQAINRRTLTKYEALWRRNTQRNLHFLATLPGVDTLPKNSVRSAIVVAAGPTLESLLPKLAALYASPAAELQERTQRIETLKEAPDPVLDPDAYRGKFELNKKSDENDDGWYYSHFITDIGKGSLIERIPRPNRGVQASFPFVKDTTLLEILQESFAKKDKNCQKNGAPPVLIAVDTALRSLLAAGIEPNYVVVADAQYWNARHLTGLAAPHATLVTEIAVHPSVFRFPCARILLYDSANPITRELCAGLPAKGTLAAGGSVASVAWDLARRLGAADIYLAGLDLAFPRKRTHARGSLFEGQSHQRSSRLAPQETAATAALFSAPTVLASDYAGRPVLTDQRMRLYAWWFESAIAAHPEVRTWSLSDESLAIPGVRVKKGEHRPKE